MAIGNIGLSILIKLIYIKDTYKISKPKIDFFEFCQPKMQGVLYFF